MESKSLTVKRGRYYYSQVMGIDVRCRSGMHGTSTVDLQQDGQQVGGTVVLKLQHAASLRILVDLRLSVVGCHINSNIVSSF